MKNDVCYHPYYGTQKVIDSLKKYDSFDKGFIEFKAKNQDHYQSNFDIGFDLCELHTFGDFVLSYRIVHHQKLMIRSKSQMN